MSDVKRTLREDAIARTTRIIRDQAYRACNYDSTDPEYQIIKYTLTQVRDQFRAGV